MNWSGREGYVGTSRSSKFRVCRLSLRWTVFGYINDKYVGDLVGGSENGIQSFEKVGFRRRGRFYACRSLRPLGPGSCDGTFEYSAIRGQERVVFRHSQQIPEPCRGRTFRSERPGGAFGGR
jgi:hypothetical protein